MNFYVIGSCFFMRVQQVNPVNGDPVPGSERGYGFLSREADYGVTPDYKQCVYYPTVEYDLIFDGWMHTGRIFSFISAILAAVCFLVLLLTCCCAFSPSMFERWLFWMYISAAICIALSFFAYGSEWCSESDCKVADGSGWAISAFMFHLVSANTVKSFAAAGAPPSADVDEEEDANDQDLDDLYYENEQDKYPPLNPNGPRGIRIRKNGKREFDNGEEYYDDLGRMRNPNGDDDRGTYRRARKFDSVASDDLQSADFDGISDHDLDEYASDNDDDDEEEEAKFDEYGNRIYDPNSMENGHMGVGYEQEHQEYDEFGNPIAYDEFGNPYYTNPHDGAPQPEAHYDEYGNAVQLPEDHVSYDEFGNAILYDEYGNPYLTPVTEENENDQSVDNLAYDEYGNPVQNDDRVFA